MLASPERSTVSIGALYRRFAAAVVKKPFLYLLPILITLVASGVAGPNMYGRVKAISDGCGRLSVDDRLACYEHAQSKWELLARIQGITLLVITVCAVATIGTIVFYVYWSRRRAGLRAQQDDAYAAKQATARGRAEHILPWLHIAWWVVAVGLYVEAIVWSYIV